jgi:hypothetical protein
MMTIVILKLLPVESLVVKSQQTSSSLGKGLNNNILLRSITYVIMSPDEDKPMAQAVKLLQTLYW